ncbi:MAG: hypothetical protein EXQ47_12315 [Bryobacterales bacterium]|nr:hypothetical protein [Bryobacterales bacterium]
MEKNRLKKLAVKIDALPERDTQLAMRAEQIDGLRRAGAADLHRICAELVGSINSLLSSVVVELSPDSYSTDSFHDSQPNLLQINLRGRLLMIEFRATETLISSEEFRAPYIMEGAVRSLNQDYLDREAIEEQFLYYCLDRKNVWRFFDARTYRTGLVDQDYLVSLLERLV